MPCKAEETIGTPPRSLGHVVQKRPWPAAIAALAVLLALAAPALGMRLGFPDAGNDPPDTMTRQAYDLNTEGFGPGTNGPVVDRRQASQTPEATRQMNAFAEPDPHATLTSPSSSPPRFNQAGDAALITVIPKSSPQDQATEDLVKRPA